MRKAIENRIKRELAGLRPPKDAAVSIRVPLVYGESPFVIHR